MGIHTPEFAWERGRSAVESEVRKQGLDFPQLLDNDYAYWNALGNEAWPALYLVDRCQRIRASSVGEVHLDDPSGRRLDAKIETLLSEPPGNCE